MSGPSVGALFAGYGGLELAAQDVWPGAHLSWVSEFDAGPSRILAHHWPDVPNHGDVTRIDWSAVEPVDIITGGSPCQDLSHAGKRLGMKAGTRSGLWASMCDAIETIRPSLVIWENVRGALSAPATAGRVESCGLCVDRNGGPSLRALGRVLGDLAELGYDAAWTGLRAADVGAPHGRWRVFVLAWPQGDAAALLPTPAVNDMGRAHTPDEWDEWTARMRTEHGNGNGHGKSLHVEALRLLPTPTVSEANGAGEHGTGGADLRTVVSLLPTPQAMDTAGAMADRRSTSGYGPALRDITALLPTPRATDGTKGGPNQRGSSGDLMLPSAVMLLPTPSVADVEGGRKSRSGTRSDELLLNGIAAEQRWGEYAPAIARWESIFRPAPAPTEPTGKDGAHRLSPRFVEWMMGLPVGHVTDVPGITRNDQLKALGNGVVPQQGAEGVRRCIAIARTAKAAVA